MVGLLLPAATATDIPHADVAEDREKGSETAELHAVLQDLPADRGSTTRRHGGGRRVATSLGGNGLLFEGLCLGDKSGVVHDLLRVVRRRFRR